MVFYRLKRVSDNGYLYASYLPNFSGNYSNSTNTGTFYLNVNNSATNSNTNIGGLSIDSPHTLNIALLTLALAKTFGDLKSCVSSFVEHSAILKRKVNT